MPKASEQDKTDAANQRVQEQVDKETEQGFRGVEVDPTPNENYTVSGVTSGKPVPTAAEAFAVAADNTKSLTTGPTA